MRRSTTGESASAFVLAPFHTRRQIPISVEIGGEAEEHEDRSDAEAVVPAVNLCDQTAKQGSNDRSDVDCSREDDETAGSPRFILWRIKSTHLRRKYCLSKNPSR